VSALELLACAGLVAVSAYLSSSEIALFSLSRFQLRSLKERFRSQHRKIKKLLADPGGLLITILVINEVVNIALSSIIAETVAETPKPAFLSALPIAPWALDTILGIIATTPVILILCEITPKVIAARANRLIAPATVGPLTVVYNVFKPIRLMIQAVVERVAKSASPPPSSPSPASSPSSSTSSSSKEEITGGGQDTHNPQPMLLRESDFLMMLEEGHREGAIQQGELDLIKNVFELDDLTVADVFTPLPQVQTLTPKTTLRNALQMMRSQKYSRIPVITTSPQTTKRQVIGVLYSKDLLRAKLEPELMSLAVETIMRKPIFVSPSMRLNAVFRKFKQQKTHMGVVQGSGGEALGIITMSDVLEALFEDFLPEEGDDDGETPGHEDGADHEPAAETKITRP
jgi:putative hemolysin